MSHQLYSTGTTKLVLFDLDNTLFDHDHSLRSAISIIQTKYASLAGNTVEDLVTVYGAALQQAYDKYLTREITYEESHAMKVRKFFTELGLPEPSLERVKEFRTIYKEVYRASRRATPGAVETLVQLRDNGYRTVIITNGQIEDQEAKAEAIGIRHLVDRILTSEEAGCCKPDARIFWAAIETIGTSPNPHIHMVGDSAQCDIKGALDAGISPVMYSPDAEDSKRLLFGEEVPVIRHMGEFLNLLNVDEPRLDTRTFPMQTPQSSGQV